jgi:hypothetical protein
MQLLRKMVEMIIGIVNSMLGLLSQGRIPIVGKELQFA